MGDDRVASLRELIQEIDRPLWRATAFAHLDDLERAIQDEGKYAEAENNLARSLKKDLDAARLQLEEMRKIVVTLHPLACACDLHPGGRCDACKFMDAVTLEQNKGGYCPKCGASLSKPAVGSSRCVNGHEFFVPRPTPYDTSGSRGEPLNPA